MYKSPYAILGLAEDADADVVRAAYRALAKKYHPDSGVPNVQRFMEIQEAYKAIQRGDYQRPKPEKPVHRTAEPSAAPKRPAPAQPAEYQWKPIKQRQYSFLDWIGYGFTAAFLLAVALLFAVVGLVALYNLGHR